MASGVALEAHGDAVVVAMVYHIQSQAPQNHTEEVEEEDHTTQVLMALSLESLQDMVD
jgi:hypothetical protein